MTRDVHLDARVDHQPVLRLPGHCVGRGPDGATCDNDATWGVCSNHTIELERLQGEERTGHVRCRGTTSNGASCTRPSIEWDLCRLHLGSLEARLLAQLLSRTCKEETESGRPCSGDLADLCPTHRTFIAQRELREVIASSLGDVRAPSPASARPGLPDSLTPNQARARLEEILALRRCIPDRGEAYTIPFDHLRFEQRKAYGPSLVDGDEAVAFWYFEKTPDGTIVVSHGVNGSKAGKDMPLASRRLYLEMMELLKHLPGYTEICEETGERLHQPLATIAYKLLRGVITLGDVHFARLSKEGIQRRRGSEVAEQLPGSRKLIRLTPTEIARALMQAGATRAATAKALSAMWKDAPTEDIDAAIDAVAGSSQPPATDPPLRSERFRVALSRSALSRFGHAVLRTEVGSHERAERGPSAQADVEETVP